MPVVPIIVAVAVDVAAEIGAADLIATVAAGTIFADAVGTLTVVGDIAAGALGGLIGGAVTAGITGGNPLTGALEGAAGGALGGGITGLSSGVSIAGGELPTSAVATDVGAGTLSGGGFFSGIASSVANATGIPTQAVNTVLKTLTQSATGALKSAATGGDPAQGALGGAITGGVGAGLGAGVSDVVDVNQIASSTGLPVDVVKGVIQGLGQAATGAAASAATGGDPGIAAAGDFTSGILPSALQYAENGAKSLYNSLVSGGQQAISDIVDAAQTKIATLQTTLQQTWDGAISDAQASYQAALDSANSQLQTMANQGFLGLAFAEGQAKDPNSFPDVQTALQNLQTVTAQAQQAQQDAEAQAQKIVDDATAQINAYQNPDQAASDYFTKAYQTAAQGLSNGDSPDQVQASVNAINPLSGGGTPTSAPGDSGQVTAPSTLTPEQQQLLDNSPPLNPNEPSPIQEPGVLDLGTVHPLPQGQGGGTGTQGGFDFTPTVTAPTATDPDQRIMQLVGLTSPESAGAGGGGGGNAAPSRTNFDFSKAGFHSGAAPPQPGQPVNIEPGSAALAQALSIPGAGPGLGGDIFGTKGQRTPIWNLESLRSEDTSGV